VTHHQKALQFSLLLHGLESEQGPQGLARTRSRMDQDIASVACFRIQSSAEQLNELLLPLTGLDPAARAVSWELKRRTCDRSAAKVRSF
jgi:hypothetical protein